MGPLAQGALIIASYLLGAIPFGLLLARAAVGVDVREIGSGNTGATNVSRAAGKRVGALVLVLDGGKAWAPTFLAQLAFPLSPSIPACCGLAAVLGHCFSVFLRGNGGKGVASALGAMLALAPLATLAGVGAFTLVLAATRVVALGSIAGGFAAAIATWFLGAPLASELVATVLALLILLRHRENLRLLRESRAGER